MKLTSEKYSTQLCLQEGLKTWDELLFFIQNLPYGRILNREDISLVLTERKGTCSSKHALLKQVASENAFENIKLYIGIYKMTEANTPGIGSGISENDLNYIPEAHCYLKIDDVPVDVTSNASDFSRIKNDILEETEIEPHQVSEFKVALHQKFIKEWLKKEQIQGTFKEIWKLREQCIRNLSQT